MPFVVRAWLVRDWLQRWKSGSLSNFLTFVATCCKQHADGRTSRIDAASVLVVKEEALTATSAIQVADFAI